MLFDVSQKFRMFCRYLVLNENWNDQTFLNWNKNLEWKKREREFTCENNNKFLVTHYSVCLLKMWKNLRAGDWRCPKRLIELMCVSTIPMMKSVITEKTLSWKRYDLFIVHAFSQFLKYNLYFFMWGTFLWFPHCRAVCVYFPSLHENVYGVHVNRFVYSDDVKFYRFSSSHSSEARRLFSQFHWTARIAQKTMHTSDLKLARYVTQHSSISDAIWKH